MASTSILYNIQPVIENAARSILSSSGFTNIFTSRSTGSKDVTPFCSIEYTNQVPFTSRYLSGSYAYYNCFDATLTTVVITERVNSEVSHSNNVALAMDLLSSPDNFNTGSLLPYHAVLLSKVTNQQYQSEIDADRFLDGTQIQFAIKVFIKPESWD